MDCDDTAEQLLALAASLLEDVSAIALDRGLARSFRVHAIEVATADVIALVAALRIAERRGSSYRTV